MKDKRITMSTHLFDELPTDMIYWEIFRYLDYNSRVTANTLLPPKDRLGIPLKKNTVTLFAIRYGSAHILKRLREQVRATNRRWKTTLTYKFLKEVLEHPEIFQYNRRFRDGVIAKAQEFLDPGYFRKRGMTLYSQKRLNTECTTALAFIDAHPYIREVSNEWTL